MFNCDKCKDEYVDSAVYFKIRFRVLDINTKKDCCGTSRLFNEKCLCSTSPFGYV